MAIYKSNFGKLLEPGLRKVFFEEWEQWPEEYSKVFNVLASTKDTEKDLTSSGFPAMPEKIEGQDIAFYDAYQGYQTSYTHTTYGMGFKVSREMWEDDLYGISRKWSRSLGTSARQTVEVTAANILNNGFTTTGADGKALCATDHPLLGGGDEQNELTAAADLSISSLDEARYVMEETVNDQGLLLMIRPKYLIVPPELEFTARELIGSQYKPVATGATYINYGHTTNVIQDYGLQLIVMHYLTDDDAWFLLSPVSPLNFFWRRKIAFGQDNEFAA
ncbi:MAG: Mu-like prophage major head subunit gpT family protein, partial [Candidatus Hermodarchaeota archaeon]|nr:Mu-like prophage major head subunit gpT family protein [Candidatus Hermodarchaeota archaeon]